MEIFHSKVKGEGKGRKWNDSREQESVQKMVTELSRQQTAFVVLEKEEANGGSRSRRGMSRNVGWGELFPY